MSSRAANYTILGVILLIAVLNIFALIHDWYFHHWWLDIPMHMIGGFWIGFVALAIIQWKGKRALPLKERLGYAFLLAFGIGVLWEMFEYLTDTSFALESYVYDPVDTFSDLLNDLIGGFLAGFVGHIHQHHHQAP